MKFPTNPTISAIICGFSFVELVNCNVIRTYPFRPPLLERTVQLSIYHHHSLSYNFMFEYSVLLNYIHLSAAPNSFGFAQAPTATSQNTFASIKIEFSSFHGIEGIRQASERAFT